MLAELSHSLRSLAKSPVFTFIAVVTLALGIGLNTAMFSFVNTLLLRPLPFPDSEQIVRLFRKTQQNPYGSFSPADYFDLKHEESAFGHFAGYQWSNLTLEGTGRAPSWLRASTDLFTVLGVQPELGRSFRNEEETKGNDRVVLISHQLWQDRFGGAKDIIGRTVRADGDAYEIIGVLPPSVSDHRLFGNIGVISPLSFESAARMARNDTSLNILARRKSTIAPAQGDAFIASFGARLAADHPAENSASGWWGEALPIATTGPTGKMVLGLLLGLSGCVLAIACSNLANFSLARTMDRTREFAVRSAVGASRLQLIRPLVLESLLQSLAGGIGALLVAIWTTDWLRSVITNGGGPAFAFPMDWRVLGFALLASIATLLFFTTAPALFALRVNVNNTLKSGSRGATASAGHQRLRHFLLVCQFTFATVLLAGAGFFMRGSANLLKQHFGWESTRVLQANLQLPASSSAADRNIDAIQQRVIERVQQLPGVESASVSRSLPYLGLGGSAPFVVEGREESSNTAGIPTQLNAITPSYFKVTGTRLLTGRAFGPFDTAASPKVVIINETMAHRIFPGGNPIGRRIARSEAESREWLEIVGVVADVISIDVAQPTTNIQLYQPTTQVPGLAGVLAVRTAGVSPESLAASVRTAIAGIDPRLTVDNLMPAEQAMKQITSQMTLVQSLLGTFALLGLFLAVIGIYGAMARMVVQRTAEIGIRMALGAQVGNVLKLFLALGVRIASVSVVLGLFGAFGLSRLLGAFLPSMQSNHALVIALVSTTVVTIALLACWLPAQRATKVNPIEALRAE